MQEIATLFVYYKLPFSEHERVKSLVRKMINSLMEKDSQLCVDLMQRPDISDEGVETWMEIYSHPFGISSEMILMISEFAKTFQLPTPRKLELFVQLR